MADSGIPSGPTEEDLVLADDVYFCVTEGQGIFLDLNRDDYNAIPVVVSENGKELDVERAVRQAFEIYRQDLLDAHLLKVSDGSESRFQAFRSLVRPVSNIFSPDDQRAFGLAGELARSVGISVIDVLDFFVASRRASRLLKKHHIHAVVGEVRLRKSLATAGAENLERLRRHTAIFRKLRPWYPRGYVCLYDALALIEFLARRGLFPTWVFAVQAQPFGAHCWVQQGDMLLNESTEYAGQFTPIMSV